MGIAVRFEDHSERIIELLERKLRAGLGEAARILGEDYSSGLQRETAPEHSAPGQIPHRYWGWKPDGYGPLNAPERLNNIPELGFSAKQGDYLAEYIRGTGVPEGQKLQGLVGFEETGHVTRREQNYLIHWDQGTVKGLSGVRRPWVRPIYDKSKPPMIDAFKEKFRETQ